MMNLMHWRLLVAVADHGSITAAAERVGMTQSAASQAMASMEAALGAQLFTREPRKTLPTALGGRVIEHARVMMGALQAIRTTVDESRPLLSGSLRIASFPMVLATFLTPLLQRFRQLHPGIEITTLDVTDSEVHALLDAELIDLGVVLNPEPARNATVLGRDFWMAVLPTHHPIAQRPADGDVLKVQRIASQLRQEKPLAEVDQHELAVLRVGNHMQPMGQDKRHGFVRKRPHRATNMLHGVAAQVDLDLEVFMPMRAGQRRPPAFIADIEVGAVAALFHAIGGNAGAWHNGLSGGLGTTLALSLIHI